jgi:hypothetical protein
MPELPERVRQEVAAIASAPIAFTLMVLAAGVVMWALTQWSYSALLSGKDSQIAFLERRLGDWRDKMAGMSPDEAKARVQALESQLKMLEIRLQPRRLSDEQRQVLVDRARLRPGVQYTLTVLREADCSDCDQFAAQLVAALRESSGWSINIALLPEAVEKPRYGLGIRVADPLRPPSEAVRLQGMLQSARVAFEMIAGGVGAGVELVVTERPLQ